MIEGSDRRKEGMNEVRKGVIEGRKEGSDRRKEGRKERNGKMRKKNVSTLTYKIFMQTEVKDSKIMEVYPYTQTPSIFLI